MWTSNNINFNHVFFLKKNISTIYLYNDHNDLLTILINNYDI
jgi:hypothetical protein